MSFCMIYPEKRIVSDEQVLSWHSDLAMDEGLEPTNDIIQAVHVLEDWGLITVASSKKLVKFD